MRWRKDIGRDPSARSRPPAWAALPEGAALHDTLDTAQELSFAYSEAWKKKATLFIYVLSIALTVFFLLLPMGIFGPVVPLAFLFVVSIALYPLINNAIAKYAEKQAGLVLNPSGVALNLISGSIRFIRWDEIAGFHTHRTIRKGEVTKELVVIDLLHVNSTTPAPQAQKALTESGQDSIGSPYYIDSSLLAGLSHEALMKACNAYVARYRKRA